MVRELAWLLLVRLAGTGSLVTTSGMRGVLLSLAHLVAARPVRQPNASVVPFSQSSAEFAQARRALKGYVMDDSTIRTAVAAWLADATAAEATYGHISKWETGDVTDMLEMFEDDDSFNEDIGAWDTSSVTDFRQMFYRARAFDQDLGWCVDDDVGLIKSAFTGTKCESTDCGVAQKDVIGICESPCLISNKRGQCKINSPTLIMIILPVLLAGAGAYVRCKKKKDETYAAAARRVLCCRGTKARAVAPTSSEEAPALPASMVSVVDAPAAGIAPNELGTVVSVKH